MSIPPPPPGYRFLPTDEELCFYLWSKMYDPNSIPSYTVSSDQDDIYSREPWTLDCKSLIFLSFLLSLFFFKKVL